MGCKPSFDLFFASNVFDESVSGFFFLIQQGKVLCLVEEMENPVFEVFGIELV